MTIIRGHSDPRDEAVNYLSFEVHEMVVSSAVGLTFKETAFHAKATASNCLAKANRASHVPRVVAKERVRKARENPKENTTVPKVPKVRTRVKPRKQVYQVLKT